MLCDDTAKLRKNGDRAKRTPCPCPGSFQNRDTTPEFTCASAAAQAYAFGGYGKMHKYCMWTINKPTDSNL